MNCLIKKGPYKTEKSHILSGKTYTFHMNMFLIVLIYHLINDFFDFPRASSRKNTVLLKKTFLNGNVIFAFKHKNIVY